ncbi:MAG: hypothetical protein IT381_07600 [Deltaproteobacteria bacterium]|nr:hypothetical protein [Deltaproteobacteria bacterium]
MNYIRNDLRPKAKEADPQPLGIETEAPGPVVENKQAKDGDRIDENAVPAPKPAPKQGRLTQPPPKPEDVVAGKIKNLCDGATSWRDEREIVRLVSEYIETGPANEKKQRAAALTKAIGDGYGRMIAEMDDPGRRDALLGLTLDYADAPQKAAVVAELSGGFWHWLLALLHLLSEHFDQQTVNKVVGSIGPPDKPEFIAFIAATREKKINPEVVLDALPEASRPAFVERIINELTTTEKAGVVALLVDGKTDKDKRASIDRVLLTIPEPERLGFQADLKRRDAISMAALADKSNVKLVESGYLDDKALQLLIDSKLPLTAQDFADLRTRAMGNAGLVFMDGKTGGLKATAPKEADAALATLSSPTATKADRDKALAALDHWLADARKLHDAFGEDWKATEKAMQAGENRYVAIIKDAERIQKAHPENALLQKDCGFIIARAQRELDKFRELKKRVTAHADGIATQSAEDEKTLARGVASYRGASTELEAYGAFTEAKDPKLAGALKHAATLGARRDELEVFRAELAKKNPRSAAEDRMLTLTEGALTKLDAAKRHVTILVEGLQQADDFIRNERADAAIHGAGTLLEDTKALFASGNDADFDAALPKYKEQRDLLLAEKKHLTDARDEATAKLEKYKKDPPKTYAEVLDLKHAYALLNDPMGPADRKMTLAQRIELIDQLAGGLVVTADGVQNRREAFRDVLGNALRIYGFDVRAFPEDAKGSSLFASLKQLAPAYPPGVLTGDVRMNKKGENEEVYRLSYSMPDPKNPKEMIPVTLTLGPNDDFQAQRLFYTALDEYTRTREFFGYAHMRLWISEVYGVELPEPKEDGSDLHALFLNAQQVFGKLTNKLPLDRDTIERFMNAEKVDDLLDPPKPRSHGELESLDKKRHATGALKASLNVLESQGQLESSDLKKLADWLEVNPSVTWTELVAMSKDPAKADAMSIGVHELVRLAEKYPPLKSAFGIDPRGRASPAAVRGFADTVLRVETQGVKFSVLFFGEKYWPEGFKANLEKEGKADSMPVYFPGAVALVPLLHAALESKDTEQVRKVVENLSKTEKQWLLLEWAGAHPTQQLGKVVEKNFPAQWQAVVSAYLNASDLRQLIRNTREALPPPTQKGWESLKNYEEKFEKYAKEMGVDTKEAILMTTFNVIPGTIDGRRVGELGRRTVAARALVFAYEGLRAAGKGDSTEANDILNKIAVELATCYQLTEAMEAELRVSDEVYRTGVQKLADSWRFAGEVWIEAWSFILPSMRALKVFRAATAAKGASTLVRAWRAVRAGTAVSTAFGVTISLSKQAFAGDFSIKQTFKDARAAMLQGAGASVGVVLPLIGVSRLQPGAPWWKVAAQISKWSTAGNALGTAGNIAGHALTSDLDAAWKMTKQAPWDLVRTSVTAFLLAPLARFNGITGRIIDVSTGVGEEYLMGKAGRALGFDVHTDLKSLVRAGFQGGVQGHMMEVAHNKDAAASKEATKLKEEGTLVRMPGEPETVKPSWTIKEIDPRFGDFVLKNEHGVERIVGADALMRVNSHVNNKSETRAALVEAKPAIVEVKPGGPVVIEAKPTGAVVKADPHDQATRALALLEKKAETTRGDPKNERQHERIDDPDVVQEGLTDYYKKEGERALTEHVEAVLEHPDNKRFEADVTKAYDAKDYPELMPKGASKEKPGKGKSSEIYQVKDQEGNTLYFFKPFGDGNASRVMNELGTYTLDSALGLGLSPKVTIGKVDGKMGAVIEAVGKPFQELPNTVKAQQELMGPDYERAIADLRAFDYLTGNNDRHSNGNVWVDPNSFSVKVIDHESSFRGGLVPTKKADRPISGGVLPVELYTMAYSERYIAGFKKLSPDGLRQQFSGILSAPQIEMLVARYYVQKADIAAKHPGAFAEAAPAKMAEKPSGDLFAERKANGKADGLFGNHDAKKLPEKQYDAAADVLTKYKDGKVRAEIDRGVVVITHTSKDGAVTTHRIGEDGKPAQAAPAPGATIVGASSHVKMPGAKEGEGASLVRIDKGEAVFRSDKGEKRVSMMKVIAENPHVLVGSVVTVDKKVYVVRSYENGQVTLRPHGEGADLHMPMKDLYGKAAESVNALYKEPRVRVMREVKVESELKLKDDHDFVLVRVEGDKAVVRDVKTGKTERVPHDRVAYEQSGLALSAMPQVTQRRYDQRMEKLFELGNEQALAEWGRFRAEVADRSPEHAAVVARMFANGATIEKIKATYEKIKGIAREDLAEALSMRGLYQHLKDSCAPTAAQWGLGARAPDLAYVFTSDPKAVQQIQHMWLKRGGGGSKSHERSAYEDFTRADPTRVETDHTFYVTKDLQGDETAKHLLEMKKGETAFVEVSTKKGTKRYEIYVDGNPKELRMKGLRGLFGPVKLVGTDGGITLNGKTVTAIGVPHALDLPAQHGGMMIDTNPDIMLHFEAVVGEKAKRHDLGGTDEADTKAMVRAQLADGKPVPLAVRWETDQNGVLAKTGWAANGHHQLWLHEMKVVDGVEKVLVFDPDPAFQKRYPDGAWLTLDEVYRFPSPSVDGVIGRPYLVWFAESVPAPKTVTGERATSEPGIPDSKGPKSDTLAHLEKKPDSVLKMKVQIDNARYEIVSRQQDGGYSLKPLSPREHRLSLSERAIAQLPEVQKFIRIDNAPLELADVYKDPTRTYGVKIEVDGESYTAAKVSHDGESILFTPDSGTGPLYERRIKDVVDMPEYQHHAAENEPFLAKLEHDTSTISTVKLQIDGETYVQESIGKGNGFNFATKGLKKTRHFSLAELAARPEVRQAILEQVQHEAAVKKAAAKKDEAKPGAGPNDVTPVLRMNALPSADEKRARAAFDKATKDYEKAFGDPTPVKGTMETIASYGALAYVPEWHLKILAVDAARLAKDPAFQQRLAAYAALPDWVRASGAAGLMRSVVYGGPEAAATIKRFGEWAAKDPQGASKIAPVLEEMFGASNADTHFENARAANQGAADVRTGREQKGRSAWADNERAGYDAVVADLIARGAKGETPGVPFETTGFGKLVKWIASSWENHGDMAGFAKLLADYPTVAERKLLNDILYRQKNAGLDFDAAALRRVLSEVMKQPTPGPLAIKNFVDAHPGALKPERIRIDGKRFSKHDDKIYGADLTKLLASSKNDLGANGAALESIMGRPISRAVLEKAFTPPIEGLRTEVVGLQEIKPGYIMVKMVIRDADGRPVATINRSFEKAADGHLIVHRSLFTIDQRYQGNKIAEAVDPQLTSFLKAAVDPKRLAEVEIRVLANISVGVYEWAKTFAWKDEQTRDNMKHQARMWLEEMRYTKPEIYTDAVIADALRFIDAAKSPRDIAMLDVVDPRNPPKMLRISDPDAPDGLRIKDDHLGKVMMLMGVSMWEGVQRPFANNAKNGANK